MMREVKRLLKPDGLFIVSVPNKETYNADGAPNPFHVRELAFEEFNTLLTRYFPTVSYFGQHVHSVSSMWPLKNASSQPVQEFDVERRNGEFRSVDSDKRPALYFVGIASEAPRNDYQGSILLDCSDQFIRDKDEALAWRAKQVQELVRLNDDLDASDLCRKRSETTR
jgi:hypothetical protein